MSLDNLAIEYRPEVPTAEEFERLFRSSGWTEALEVAADRLAATLPHAWYGICASRGGQIVGTGLVLSDGDLNALMMDVIPEMRTTERPSKMRTKDTRSGKRPDRVSLKSGSA